jgi:pimeloyl-ACP methyl ester carboxylesterase
MYDEQIIALNDKITINYTSTPTSGHPIVLLHGVASEWQSFLPIIPVLACEFQVYAIDLRGHGKSSWATEGYRLLDYAEDIQCFLDQQIAQPTILYGHSLGAQVAIAVAAQSPTHIRALILGDPPFYFHNMTTRESVWREPFVELHHLISTMHSAQEMDDYMAKHYPNMEPQRRKARAETLSHVDPGVIAAILEDRHVEGYDSDALLRQITCQVLLIQGNAKLGSAMKAEDAAYMVERLHRCDIVHMQDVGHGLPSGESLSKVENFLKSV